MSREVCIHNHQIHDNGDCSCTVCYPQDKEGCTVHLDMGGGVACHNFGQDSTTSRDPFKITCKTCLRTKAFSYYKIGYKRGVAEFTFKMTKVLNPILKLFMEGIHKEL